MESVLDAPVAAHDEHQQQRTHFIGGETGDQVTNLVTDQTLPISHFGVDTQNQLDAWKRRDLTDVVDLFAFENPELADVELAFFYSEFPCREHVRQHRPNWSESPPADPADCLSL
jgi:hypothetical protein